jgi:hypothetical protein
MVERETQVAGHLPHKHKILSSNPSTAKKKKNPKNKKESQ